MRWLGGIVLAAVGGMALAACPAMAANFSVGMVGSASGPRFSPETITVAQGDSVSWTNGGGFHDVTFEDGLFKQPPTPSADIWTVSRTFDTSGTYLYYCSVHQSIGMIGSVVVNAATSTGSSGTPATSVPGTPGATVGAQGQPTPCKSQRNFQIRVRQPRGVKIKSASVSVNGTPVKVRQFVVGGKLRHVAQVDLRGLGKGTYKVDIIATTDKGKKLRGTRTYQTCVAKLVSSGLPPL